MSGEALTAGSMPYKSGAANGSPRPARGDRSSLLYITWDGPGALYLRSLYLPIFARLGLPVDVLQITYGEPAEVEATRAAASALGIGFRAQHFERRRSTLQTVARGATSLVARSLQGVWSEPRRLVMARSLLPAAAAMVAGVPRGRFIFDADGLPADERLEFGAWSRTALPYRAARAIERRALHHAAISLTRTTHARDILLERAGGRARVVVARNGSDEERFRPLPAAERELARSMIGIAPRDKLVVYAGSLGPQYRPDSMAAFVRSYQRHYTGGQVHFMLLTPNVEAGARVVADAEIPSACRHVRRAEPEEVARLLALGDFALAFRASSFSQQAVCPIKVGEYLLCGVPVVANRGVGDLDRVLTPEVALLTPQAEVADAEAAGELAARSKLSLTAVRELAVESFGLMGAVAGYRAAIDAVLAP